MHFFLDSFPGTTGFKHVSVGKSQVWAVTNGGVLVRREGICSGNPGGSGWDVGIPVSTFLLKKLCSCVHIFEINSICIL